MKEFRILFYRAKLGDGKWIDDGINIWSWIANQGFRIKHKIPLKVYNKLACSHVEGLEPENLPEGGYTFGERVTKFLGTCWTSTLGQASAKGRKYNGACKRPADEVLKHPKRWFYATVQMPDVAYEYFINSLQEAVDAKSKYETPLLRRFFMPNSWVKDDPNEYICSEFMEDKLRDAFGRGLLLPWNSQEICLCCYLKTHHNVSPLRLALLMYLSGYRFYDLNGK